MRLTLGMMMIAVSANAAPFLAIGDGAELFVSGGVGVRADDNIYLSTDNGKAPGAPSQIIRDVVFDTSPGLTLEFGKNSQIKGSLGVSFAITNYADNSNLNNELFASDFSSSYDDGKLKLSAHVGYRELNQNSVDIRDLTRRDSTSAGGTGELTISDKTSVGSGFTFDRVSYKRSGYSNSDTTTIPLNVFYKITPKVALSLGYQYRNTSEQAAGADSNDHFLNLGARGEFTPKLSGSLRIGYNRREVDAGSDQSDLGVDSSLSLALTPKTSLTIGVNRDFATTPQGGQQKNTSVNGGLSSSISDQLSLNANLSYRALNYGTRTDDYFEGSLGGSYVLTSYLQLAASYTYRNNSSVLKSGEFTNNVFSLSASLRY